ncbi:MAG: hypothetical protein KC413_17570, partial [Anaerolineales bacterium]|nr:hypothetical protein [Anaerolineales bacterium]
MNKKTSSLGSVLIVVILAILSLVFGQDFLGELGLGEATSTQSPISSNNGGGGDTAVNGDWYDIYFTNPTCP